jgi:NAD(P)-dependent dehydrogenase (short-subunit alcohol dehydrogenase family)
VARGQLFKEEFHMDIAIVTGASGTLGIAISKRLIQLGFRVYGLGGDYKDCPLQNLNFKPMACDLADPKAVEAACGKILEKEKGVCVIVNNAKYFGRHPFLKMDTAEIERILRINLLCPLVLARVFAESLRSLQGYLIQLGAPFAEYCSGGAVGAASSGGLKWMGEQLFSELRDSGVRVCHLSPEPNRVADARKRVRRGARTEASIDPEAVVQAIEQILQSPFGNVVTEMVLRPLRVNEPDLDPVVNLPYPDPQPIPYTVPREIIEAEEQLEEEEWKKQEENRKRKRHSKSQAKKTAAPTGEDNEQQPKTEPKADQSKEKMEPEEVPGGASRRRRSRRKPRPPRVDVGFHKPEPEKPKPVDPQPAPRPVKKTARPGHPKADKTPEKKPATKKTVARKSPARKATTKKAAKKATRKAPAKKNVRKVAAKKTAAKSDNGKETA